MQGGAGAARWPCPEVLGPTSGSATVVEAPLHRLHRTSQQMNNWFCSQEAGSSCQVQRWWALLCDACAWFLRKAFTDSKSVHTHVYTAFPAPDRFDTYYHQIR